MVDEGVGELVGARVGELVGAGVGEQLGAGVGELVGAGVGELCWCILSAPMRGLVDDQCQRSIRPLSCGRSRLASRRTRRFIDRAQITVSRAD